jgi:prevent-host-death family protein
MNSTYSVSQAQSKLPRLLKDAAQGAPIAITRHDQTVAFLVSRERMEAIAETLEILGNAEAMQTLRRYRQGHTRFLPLSALDD